MLLRRIGEVEYNDDEAFTLLMGLDGFLQNSDYKKFEKPRYKEDEIRALV